MLLYLKPILEKKESSAPKLQWLMEGTESKIQHTQRLNFSAVAYD